MRKRSAARRLAKSRTTLSSKLRMGSVLTRVDVDRQTSGHARACAAAYCALLARFRFEGGQQESTPNLPPRPALLDLARFSLPNDIRTGSSRGRAFQVRIVLETPGRKRPRRVALQSSLIPRLTPSTSSHTPLPHVPGPRRPPQSLASALSARPTLRRTVVLASGRRPECRSTRCRPGFSRTQS